MALMYLCRIGICHLSLLGLSDYKATWQFSYAFRVIGDGQSHKSGFASLKGVMGSSLILANERKMFSFQWVTSHCQGQTYAQSNEKLPPRDYALDT